MAVATFDTLKFANTLKAAGVPDKQAEAQAVAFAEVIQVNFKDLVTKDDLSHAVELIKADVKDTERQLDKKITELRGEFTLLKWMFGVMIAGIVTILVRLFLFRG